MAGSAASLTQIIGKFSNAPDGCTAGYAEPQAAHPRGDCGAWLKPAGHFRTVRKAKHSVHWVMSPGTMPGKWSGYGGLDQPITANHQTVNHDTAVQGAGAIDDHGAGGCDHDAVEFRRAVEREAAGSDFEREPRDI